MKNVVDSTDESKQTALHIAASKGDTDIVNLLLEKDANIVIDNRGYTPLHYAALNDHAEIVKVLIKATKYVNIDAVKNNVCNPLYLAARRGYTDTVKLLLENEYWTPLHLAVIQNKIEDVKNLLLRSDINTFFSCNQKLLNQGTCHPFLLISKCFPILFRPIFLYPIYIQFILSIYCLSLILNS